MSGAKNENVNKNVRDECVMMCRKRVKEYRENLFRLLGDYTFDGSLICGNLGRNLDRRCVAEGAKRVIAKDVFLYISIIEMLYVLQFYKCYSNNV